MNFVDPNIQIFIFSKYFRLLQWQMRYRFWLCRQIWWILLRLFAIWWKLCQRIDSKRWNRGSFDYLHERFSFGFSIYRNHWSEIHRLFLLKSTHYFFSWTKMWLLTLKTCSCHFVQYFRTLFWDDITIICWWKLSKQTSYSSKTGFFFSVKKVNNIFIPNYHDIIPK